MAEKTKNTANSKAITDFLADAQERFKKLWTNDDHNRIRARDNLRFTYEIGQGQWSQEDRSQRENEGRPCLTSNKLRKFAASVANTERDQRMAGNVIPVDGQGDEVVAMIMSGIMRQVEHASHAEKVYTDAGEQAIAGGEGFWRITSEELPDSFDQELFIRGIQNQFSVHLDPKGMFGFIGEKLTKEEFEHRYPDAVIEDADSNTDNYDLWYHQDDVFVREYFYKERVKVTVVQASKVDPSGQLPTESKIFELPTDISEEEFKKEGWVIDTRPDGTELKKTPEVFKVKWAKITATQILEEGDWVGKDIPIIEVEGDWVWLEGRLYKKSLTEAGKDDQRMYNYWLSSITERYALAIKAPYLVTTVMVEGLKDLWDMASKKMMSYLPYKHDKKVPGGPKREAAPQISTGEVQMLGITNANIEDTIGRFKATFGQASNERSQVAIKERAARSELSTFHFPDNFRRAHLKSVRMLIDLIPKIYDTQRVQRILGDDGKQDFVVINHEVTDEETGEKRKINDLSVGKYDVVESVKIMSTRKQEMLDGMKALASGNPQLGVILAPHIAKAEDWDGHLEIAKEIRKLTPLMLGIKPQEEEAQPQS